jgi:signal transduction histidine kinase
MEVNISRFNVYELVKKCIELMSSLALKKNISFVIEGEKNIEISADANLIERVYINLIGNAIKFTPQDGRITIGFLIKDNKFRSWVEDTGEGIPLEYIDRIFSKFEQVKGQKVGGTGLGLTISKHIIEAHLGKIWAEYRPNMGAKFVFEFPMDLKKNEFGKILSG